MSVSSTLASQVVSQGGRYSRLPSLSASCDYIAQLAGQINATQIVTSDLAIAELLSSTTRRTPFKVASLDGMRREDFLGALKKAEIGVTRVNLAIAETGTLVIATSDEADRLVSALPTIHIALLEDSQIIRSLDEAAPLISKMLLREKEGVTVSLISASSRTTDVGGFLILGVHGPKELHVLLVDEGLQRSS